ncbi:MAG: PAS domain S-box protein [Rhodobacteraceae bacterium]|nr:PAS domain S-box protein [Paracoccaceae bacterium]MCF8514048.1 PAS domain S-box protein [Paracoccaceae bacterium]MCF8518292.1 PAS domain S-box protein [Paracoccaceae bacterium]
MHLAADSLFQSHPDPMWIFELDSLCFLAVNDAAVAKYGYSRDEFLKMTVADLRPEEELAALQKTISGFPDSLRLAGIVRHRLKAGDFIHVSITGQMVDFEGRRAGLVAARDVSELVIAEQIATEALAREAEARRASEALAQQFQIMFDSVPGQFLVFSPESFDVIAVSEAYLAIAGVKRADIVGHNLFDVLPRQPEDEAHLKLRRSFERVLATGEPDLLEVQSFALPRAGVAQGYEERYLAMLNSPVTGPDGRVRHLILRVQDVTGAVITDPKVSSFGAKTLDLMRMDLAVHTRELKSDNLRLADLATRLRTTQRMLETGTWDYVLADDRLIWSSNVYDIYGVTPDTFGHGFEDYVALVHPDDRAAMLANFQAFDISKDIEFEYAHRILHADGKIVHVHGVAEKVDTDKGPMLSGVVQNVTESVEARQSLAQAKRLLEIAGTSAKFGAWRYDALTGTQQWSDETARIHDEPAGFSPSVADGISYYAPEYRERITTLFQACLTDGTPFSDTLQIITAKGRRIWVRATGEVERDPNGRVIAVQGSFQDISELMEVRQRAEDSEKLLEIAGKAVKLGGWRVSLGDQSVTWSDGVAAIHELPPGTRPTFDKGIAYFAPEEQQDARKAFEDCATDGVPFDNVRDVITAKGNRIKVRSLGEPVRDDSGQIIAVQGAIQDISELTAARQKADDLATRLAETLENIGDAFYMIDRDRQFTYLNGRAETLLKRSRDTLIGQPLLDAFPEIEGGALEIAFARAFETGQTERFEHFFPPLGRMLRIHAHPTPEGLAVYFSDITEEQRRQEQLRLLDAAVSHLTDIVVVVEAERAEGAELRKVVYVNDALERFTGFTAEEFSSQSLKLLQGPKTDYSELARIRKMLDAKQPARTELINYTKSGQEIMHEIDIVPVVNAKGIATHFVAILRDISPRRRAEESLRLSEARFRLIAKATGTAVWDWNIASSNQWWSDGVTDLFGYLPDIEENYPSFWRENVHHDDLQRVEMATANLVSGQISTLHERYRFRCADGRWTTVDDRAFPVLDDAGRTVRIIGSMVDVSEQVQLEERLRQSQKLEAVGQLTGGVAHDFNNLLTIILGSIEFLQDELDENHPLRVYADMSAKAADSAAELTSRLLAFSRKQALLPKVTDVNVVIAGLEGMLRRTLGEDIDIEIVRSGGLWRTEVDLGQLEGALLNLAINSRDAMPNGGSLTVETANAFLDDAYVASEPGLSSGQYVMIAISDTGQGIPRDKIDRVFEPFFTTKAVGKGTGLGLSMVYGFVKQTGGHIRIYSEPNEGTTVKLYFPKFIGGPVAEGLVTENRPDAQGNETILVVEDDTAILHQLTVQLSGLGYKIVSATEGQTALAILRERSDIDLLFTDVILPGGMNGRQIADAAQAMRTGIKVLYTSGYSENAIVHHGRLDPGVELLSKPYRRPELATKVRKVLDSK